MHQYTVSTPVRYRRDTKFQIGLAAALGLILGAGIVAIGGVLPVAISLGKALSRDSSDTDTTALYAWVQMGMYNSLHVRAIVAANTSCPLLRITYSSGTSDNLTHAASDILPMTTRAEPVEPAAGTSDPTHASDYWPVRVCTAALPMDIEISSATIRLAVVRGSLASGSELVALPLLPFQGGSAPTCFVDTMFVVGDTGCRILGNQVQNCSNTTAWPVASVAASIAAAAKVTPPRVILFVGDVLYRDSDPKDSSISTVWGNNWPTLEADWFSPMADALLVAPWINTRGNHEDCNRDGAGWNRFFSFSVVSGDPYSGNCELPNAFLIHQVCDLVFVNLDTNAIYDYETQVGSTELSPTGYSELLGYQEGAAATLLQGLGSYVSRDRTFMITHKPWGYVGSDFTSTWGWWLARPDGISRSIGLMVVGHVHAYLWSEYQATYLNGSTAVPPASFLLIGNSGTLLDKPPTPKYAALAVSGTQFPDTAAIPSSVNATRTQVISSVAGKSAYWSTFGWGIMTRTTRAATSPGDVWLFTLRDPYNKDLGTCNFVWSTTLNRFTADGICNVVVQ